MKIFELKTTEGNFIVASKNAKEAIMYFFTKYMDDIQTEELVEFEGITIKELGEKEINEQREIYNEGTGKRELVSYKKLGSDYFTGNPKMLISPVY